MENLLVSRRSPIIKTLTVSIKILGRTMNLAQQCRKLHIPDTTFMIATDPYLVEFVDQFTGNNGKAFYSSLDGLGEFYLHGL
ncbi:MAG: hypothetical protein R2769_16290 [Saprospiraceae bacterium]